MDKDRDTHLYLLNNILDGTLTFIQTTKREWPARPRLVGLSAITQPLPASLSTTTMYWIIFTQKLEQEILGDDNEEIEDVCFKLPPKSPTKIPKKHKYSFDAFDDIGSNTLVKSQSSQPEYGSPSFDYYSYNYLPPSQFMPVYHYPSDI